MSIEANSRTRENPSANLFNLFNRPLLGLPPEDAEDVGDKKDQADERREPFGVTLSFHGKALYQVADVRS